MSILHQVCLISPGHLATNPRLVKEALALKSAGYDVRVVHGHYMKWGASVDPDIANEIGSTEPVSFGPETTSAATYLRQTIIRRCARLLARAGVHIEPVIEMSVHPATRDLIRAAMAKRADLYIAHYVAALPAAYHAARKHKTLYAFDAEDFHPGDLSDDPRHRTDRALIDAIERTALPGAAYVTAAAPGIAKAYAARYEVPLPQTVLNVFPLGQAPANATTRGDRASGAPSLYWFSQTVGPDRGLECAVRGVAQARTAPALFLRGRISDAYRKKLVELASECGVAERMHFLPSANPDELVRLASTHDLGLVSETGHTENRSIALTNKQFTYLLGGVPALMTDIPAHRAFAETADGAVQLYATEDPQSLAAAIDAWLGDPNLLAAARNRAFELGQQRFNWEKEQCLLTATVKNVLRQTDEGLAT